MPTAVESILSILNVPDGDLVHFDGMHHKSATLTTSLVWCKKYTDDQLITKTFTWNIYITTLTQGYI